MRLWKALGVAGLAGVTTTGVIIARRQRARAQLGPDEVRARLHRRLEEIERGEVPDAPAGPAQEGSTDSSARA
jgi:hypothetical protein